uniref:NADH-ubiquinone oxidoreductase chain 5 n=1 Tax=Polychaeta sp. TaxID=3061522 RepID=A0AAU8L1B6_9ANNE
MPFQPRTPTISFQALLALSIFMFICALKSSSSNSTYLLLWQISDIYVSPLYFPIIIDPTGLILSTVVLFISANVMLFSNMYMQEDPFINRFNLLVLAFVLSMNMLIFLPHLMTLLLGWDGLGLISFLLVIYYQNPKSLAAGMITALTNRIGDALLLLSIAWSLNQGHWLIMNMWVGFGHNILTLCILLAAMTKSAQVPFSSWLPAAMAAPTPVSSLVHSSTLVTAGVFLLIRFYPFLHLMNWFNPVLMLTATMTMFMAGLSAMVECDLKKIIALSTLSQLGVMMASLSLGFVSLTLFHLMTHALFKALLFLCAGNVIHLHAHGQDLRTVGNLTPQIPLTMSCMLIANLSLCGAPFLAGFYSKDLILELLLSNPANPTFMVLMFIATALTATYSTRFTLYILLSPCNQTPLMNINEENMNSMVPIMNLTIGAISGGAALSWFTLPISSTPILPATMKLFTIYMVYISALWIFVETSSLALSKPMIMVHQITHQAMSFMWFLTPLSSQWLMNYSLNFSHFLLKIMDQSWVESIAAQSPHIISSTSSKSLQYLQTNTINSYIFMTILFSIPLLYYLMA